MRAQLTRRELLAAAGAATLASVSGGVAGTPTPTTWPTFGGDAANTGFSPDATGPAADVGSRWTVDTSGRVTSSPAVVDDTVFVGSWDDNVYALAVEDGGEQWRYETGGNVTSSPAVVDGTVYVGSEDGVLYALDADDGDIEWRFGTDAPITASPTVVDSVVYIGSTDGVVYAVDAGDGESLEWSVDLDFAIESTPAVVEGRVYLGSDDQTIHAFDAEDGSEEWSYATDDLVKSAPAVFGGVVYVGSNDGTLYALDGESGDELWTFETGRAIPASPAVDGDRIFVGSRDGRVYALDTDGDEQWSLDTGQAVTSSPAVTGDTVYVGSENGSVYGLDAATGETRFRYETDRRVRSSPAVVDGTVCIGSLDESVYALGEGEADGAPGTPVTTPSPDEEGALDRFGFLLWPFGLAASIGVVLGVLYATKRAGLFPEFDPEAVDAPRADEETDPVWDVVLRDVISRAEETDRTATENLLVTKYVDADTMDSPFVAYEVESFRDKPARVTLREPAPELTPDDIGLLPGSNDEWQLVDGNLVYDGVISPEGTLRTMVGRRDVDPADVERLLDAPDIEIEPVGASESVQD